MKEFENYEEEAREEEEPSSSHQPKMFPNEEKNSSENGAETEELKKKEGIQERKDWTAIDQLLCQLNEDQLGELRQQFYRFFIHNFNLKIQYSLTILLRD